MKSVQKMFNNVKNVLKPNDVYSSQRVVLLFSLVYGLIPYKLVKKQGNHKLDTAYFGFIVAVLYMLFFSSCFVITIKNQMNLMEFFIESSISNFGGNLNLITSFMSITSVYMSSLYLRGKVKRMFSILAKIDEKLYDLGIEINHTNALVYNIKCVIAAIILYGMYTVSSLAFLILKDCAEKSRISVIVTHFLPYLVLTILIYTFLNFARLIYTRFAAINKVSRAKIFKIFNIALYKRC